MDRKILVAIVVAGVALLAITLGAFEGARMLSSDSSEDVSGVRDTVNETIVEPISVTTDNSNKGTIGPYTRIGMAIFETEFKDHWDMPEGMNRVVINLSWQTSGWNLEVKTGTGECPDSGTAFAGESGSSGSILVDYTMEEGETLPEGMWFVHVACPDITSHVRETISFTYTVEIFEAPSMAA